MAVYQTQPAVDLLASIERHTHNAADVRARIEALLAEEDDQVVQVAHVIHSLRNVGKAPGAEIKVGRPTEPLNPGTYSFWGLT